MRLIQGTEYRLSYRFPRCAEQETTAVYLGERKPVIGDELRRCFRIQPSAYLYITDDRILSIEEATPRHGAQGDPATGDPLPFETAGGR